MATAAARRFGAMSCAWLITPTCNCGSYCRNRAGWCSFYTGCCSGPWWPIVRIQYDPPVYRQVCIVRSMTQHWSSADWRTSPPTTAAMPEKRLISMSTTKTVCSSSGLTEQL